MEKTGIVNFAMHILGCGCDNSVFDLIEKEDHSILNCGVKLRKKIVIGKRLLIYIADAEDIRPADIRNVISEGIAERDCMGYNRLRLAVVTPRVSDLAAAYLCEFGCLPGKDDRTHIHIVSDEDAI
ncbi:MAG TPA: hypothetical protein PKG60_14620 [Spirochaetota bacterium]|jgi:hypothetical protein|nr:hypothetical protein [Spirochaetota bacterium]